MEQDNEEISAWNDQNIQILDDRCFKFTKKKITQPTHSEQTKMSRRLIASRTLPVLKNMRSSLIKLNNTDCKQKPQRDIITDSIIEPVEKKLTYPQRVTQIEENKKQKNHHIRHNKRGHHHHRTLVMDIQHYLIADDSDTLLKHQPLSKHQKTTPTKQEQLSNISKLKIQASQYSSIPKHVRVGNDEVGNQLQVKVSKNCERESIDNNKYNSRHFVVKKETVSQQKDLQHSGRQIKQPHLRQPFQEDIKQSPCKQPKQDHLVLKQQYKNMANTIQFRKKNQYRIFNLKYNGLSKLANQKKKKTKITSPCLQKGRVGSNLTTADYAKHRGCWLSSSSQTYQHLKANYDQKLILQESQNKAYSIRLSNDRSLKTMPHQVRHQNLIIDDANQQLGFLLVRKQHTHAPIDNLVSTTTTTPTITNSKESNKISKISSRKNRLKISSQPAVLDEFNDEYIFVHK